MSSEPAPPVIALIPARGGSKAIPRKNLADVGGRSLLQRAIECGLASKRVTHTYVSSDDPEILEMAQALGSQVVERPDEFASDSASAADVVRHFAQELEKRLNIASPDTDALIVYLQPTSPFRTARHVDAALEALEASGARTLVSVVPMEPSPWKGFGVDGDGRLVPLFSSEMAHANRQDLPPAYMQNGAIYIFALSELARQEGFPSGGAIPFVMSESDSLDVDTPEDLEAVRNRAED